MVLEKRREEREGRRGRTHDARGPNSTAAPTRLMPARDDVSQHSCLCVCAVRVCGCERVIVLLQPALRRVVQCVSFAFCRCASDSPAGVQRRWSPLILRKPFALWPCANPSLLSSSGSQGRMRCHCFYPRASSQRAAEPAPLVICSLSPISPLSPMSTARPPSLLMVRPPVSCQIGANVAAGARTLCVVCVFSNRFGVMERVL